MIRKSLLGFCALAALLTAACQQQAAPTAPDAAKAPTAQATADPAATPADATAPTPTPAAAAAAAPAAITADQLHGEWSSPQGSCESGERMKITADGKYATGDSGGSWTFADGALTLKQDAGREVALAVAAVNASGLTVVRPDGASATFKRCT